MTEPKRIEDALVGYTGPKDAVFRLRSRIDSDCEFCGTKPHQPCQHTPNEAFDHPAPAPADWQYGSEPNHHHREGNSAPAPAGVPDVQGLIERARSKTYREGPDEIYYNLPNLHDELADALEIVEGENRVMRQREQTMLERQAKALAALQSQLVEEQTYSAQCDATKAQQAERITTLETENECLAASCRVVTENNDALKAKLAEAVEALRSGNPDARMNVLKTAREVVG